MFRLSQPSVGIEEEKALRSVLRSGFYVQGRQVAAFEGLAARYLNVKHAMAVNSGTSALHLALLALRIGPGDEVIVPDYTFPATANAVELCQAKAVMVDIEARTFNIDPDQIKKHITSKTKAVIPVHLFGQTADMDPILALAKKYRIAVIEDAACAMGAQSKGRKAGSLGTLACFSFHPRKILTTGEGGLVVTDDQALAGRVKLLRNHGLESVNGKIDLVCPGYNYRMTELQAAMGLVQLKKLPSLMMRRQNLAKAYAQQLRNIPWLSLPETLEGNSHAFQTYIVQLEEPLERGRFIAYLKRKGIEANIGTYAMHRLKYYKHKYRLQAGHYPVAEKIFQSTVALPFHEGLTLQNIRTIASIIRTFQ